MSRSESRYRTCAFCLQVLGQATVEKVVVGKQSAGEKQSCVVEVEKEEVVVILELQS
jgi:hypothetical protein